LGPEGKPLSFFNLPSAYALLQFIYVLTLKSPVITRLRVRVYLPEENTGQARRGRMEGVKQELPREISAVVFDLDDTLVLSTVDYGKFRQLVIEKVVSHDEPRAMYDPKETIISIMSRYERSMCEAGLSNEERSRRLAELDRIMDQVELERVSDTKAIRGAIELLEMLRDRGIKIGILTRGCRDYATTALSQAGLMQLVDAIECRNSETKAKPSPESYLRLVEQLGVRKEETLFVGDHPIDAKCAENTGVPFVAVETGDVSSDDLRAAGCVAVFPSVGRMVEWFKDILSVESKK
jgi:HAD superfamily hydrolase (TIGR01549 family)